MPKHNVATIQLSSCVVEGVSRSRNALLNGDIKNYDWDSGYTCHQLGSGAIVVQLAQPYVVSSMRYVTLTAVYNQNVNKKPQKYLASIWRNVRLFCVDFCYGTAMTVDTVFMWKSQQTIETG